ncbi:MAG: type II toxin-antitoxin system VapC family toxin [Candidatus Riflebacteria bacterium]|nr:type II toxin-antitoxin system VapC family toxin [Candidatus Riflebacteria bacterium]
MEAGNPNLVSGKAMGLVGHGRGERGLRGGSRESPRHPSRLHSAWEAGIQAALGRLRLPELIETGVEESGFEKLAILFSHAEAAARLPPHHLDPFDRLLLAQAELEHLTLVTHDRRLEPYGVATLWT